MSPFDELTIAFRVMLEDYITARCKPLDGDFVAALEELQAFDAAVTGFVERFPADQRRVLEEIRHEAERPLRSPVAVAAEQITIH